MIIKQSTAKRLPFRLVDETDGTTAETGLAGTAVVSLSKNGGAFATGVGTITEVSVGRYYYTPTTSETNTLGFLEYRVTCTGCREFPGLAQVVAYDPEDGASLGLSRLDIVLSTLATAAALTAAAGDVTTLLSRLSSSRAGYLDNLSAGAVALAADAATLLGRLSSARAGYLDNLSAGAVALAAQLPAALVGGRVDASVGAMASNVVTADALDAGAVTEIAAGITVPSAADVADAVCDEALAGHATSGTVAAALSGAATSGALASVASAVASVATAVSGVATTVSALPSAATIAATVLASTLEGAHSVAAALRLMLRIAVGRRIVSGTTITHRDLANSKDAIVATVDSSGNRSVPSALDGT